MGKMKKIRVDFIAYRSVVVAVNDEESAVEEAEAILQRKEPDVGWEYDQNCDLKEVDDEPENQIDIVRCTSCGEEYVDHFNDGLCPFCGHDAYEDEV